MTGVQNTFYYGDTEYRQRSQMSKEAGTVLAVASAALLAKALPSFSNPFLKQITIEHSRNNLYRDSFFKAVENSGLQEKGLTFKDLDFTRAEHMEMLRNPKVKIVDKDIKAGLNACYIPDSKQVVLNSKLATVTGFHELGHAKNHLDSKLGNFLQKLRKPGYILASLMAFLAFEKRETPKEAEKTFKDRIIDNSGLIAFSAIMPTVIEEAMASYKGIKLAKDAGLGEAGLNNLKKVYGKALLSYGGYAVLTALSVFSVHKILDLFYRPKKVDVNIKQKF